MLATRLHSCRLSSAALLVRHVLLLSILLLARLCHIVVHKRLSANTVGHGPLTCHGDINSRGRSPRRSWSRSFCALLNLPSSMEDYMFFTLFGGLALCIDAFEYPSTLYAEAIASPFLSDSYRLQSEELCGQTLYPCERAFFLLFYTCVYLFISTCIE